MSTDGNGTGGNRGFAKGAVATLLTLVLLAAAFRLVEWVVNQPQPQALVDFLTVARFSLLDLVGGVLGLGMLVLLITVPVWGPRP